MKHTKDFVSLNYIFLALLCSFILSQGHCTYIYNLCSQLEGLKVMV